MTVWCSKIRHLSKPLACPPSDKLLREALETINNAYPADWDYYEEAVAKNPPNAKILIPHAETGELVEVDLFTVTLDEIAEKCAVPEHWKKNLLDLCRDFLLSRMPYWDKRPVPHRILLLEK